VFYLIKILRQISVLRRRRCAADLRHCTEIWLRLFFFTYSNLSHIFLGWCIETCIFVKIILLSSLLAIVASIAALKSLSPGTGRRPLVREPRKADIVELLALLKHWPTHAAFGDGPYSTALSPGGESDEPYPRGCPTHHSYLLHVLRSLVACKYNSKFNLFPINESEQRKDDDKQTKRG